MKVSIKKAGIFIAVLAVICLLLVGVTTTLSVTDFIQNNIQVLAAQNYDIDNNQARAGIPAVPVAKYVVHSNGDYSDSKWDEAVQLSLDNKGALVEFILDNDWTGEAGYGTLCYGTYSKNDSPLIPAGANILLNLNGKTIDKNLGHGNNGEVFGVSGVLTIIDSTADPFGTTGVIKGGFFDDSGAGIIIRDSGFLNMFGGNICENRIVADCDADGAGVLAIQDATFNMYGGKISNNEITFGNNNIFARGAGVFMQYGTTFNMYGGEITGNRINYYECYGANSSSVAGVYIDSTASFTIQGNPKIYNNTNSFSKNDYDGYISGNEESNLSFDSEFNIVISGVLNNAEISLNINNFCKITTGYNNYPNPDPNTIFKIDNQKSLSAEKQKARFYVIDSECNWRINEPDSTVSVFVNGISINDYSEFTYGTNYEITAKKSNNIAKVKLSSDTRYASKLVLTEAGQYHIMVEGSNFITSFTINPQKVYSVTWSNTSFVYNGTIQAPTAMLSIDNRVVAVVSGGRKDVGEYVAYATGFVDNKNYIISGDVSTTFRITPANLNVNVTTNNVEFEYTGYNAKPSSWYTLSTTGLLGQDTSKNLNSLFTINDSAFIPKFNGGDSAVNIGEYNLSTKRIDNVNLAIYGNSNYNVRLNYVDSGKLNIILPTILRVSKESKYDYLVLEGNRRVTYSEKGWIHGVNDTARSTFNVLGNIAPFTSVQSFLNNLVFNDLSVITIKNSRGDVVYADGQMAEKFTGMIDNSLELSVGTGWTVEYERETITLSVLGDLTGDGKLNSLDVNRARKIVNENTYAEFDDHIKFAMLIINRGSITTNSDIEIMWNVVCDKMDISEFI